MHIPYQKSLEIMKREFNEVLNGNKKGVIILFESEDVYTYTKEEPNLKTNIPLIKVNRGGGITYHGLGQRVVYPILNLKDYKKDISWYVNKLQEWIINTMYELNITCYLNEKYVGVWTKYNKCDTKIASIGIAVRRWITLYGFSVNLFNNIDNFRNIVPCGIKNVKMSSCSILGKEISFCDFDYYLKKNFYKIFSN